MNEMGTTCCVGKYKVKCEEYKEVRHIFKYSNYQRSIAGGSFGAVLH